MRAKRSKKYRKIMSTYALHFSFRTPYQVLCDSNFLRQCHAFHMPVQKSLENTLHGDARPYITQCSLAKAMAAQQGKGRGDGKPLWLPLPTEVPLRYCKHKDAEGNEMGVINEADCLVDLVAGQAKGNEALKNKNHYVLATAEEEDIDVQKSQKQGQNPRKRKRGVDIREAARQVPGVPIVYVKRSVMVLEELSGVSERIIRGVEKAKFKEGLVDDARGVKRKRDRDDDSNNSDAELKNGQQQVRMVKKAKGPNPMSMKKKKVRPTPGQANGDRQEEDENREGNGQKKKRKRKHGKKSGAQQDETQSTGPVPVPAVEVEAEG